ncbi:hypothetical protein GCM10009665_45030 [Kitasatospora nipponensis]|uniref:Uncharacterized protein n=1 Tax=Kitasatospora nipponensis TaxID=258049 RepID=A0ABN1WJV0_9ACTN
MSQWRGYTEAGTGGGAYALEFAPKGAHGWATGANLGLRLSKVIYDRARQEKLCEDLVCGFVAVLDKCQAYDVAVQNEFAYRLEVGIIDFATACKHPGFAEDDEWRLIYRHEPQLYMSPPDLQFRVARGTIVPYVALPLPEPVGARAGRPLPIRHIQVGPGGDQESSMAGLRFYLDQQDDLPDGSVTGSATPYR